MIAQCEIDATIGIPDPLLGQEITVRLRLVEIREETIDVSSIGKRALLQGEVTGRLILVEVLS